MTVDSGVVYALVTVTAASLITYISANDDISSFDPSKRGTQKYGDPCSTTFDCGFHGSICHGTQKTCECGPDLPATNHVDKCGKAVGINESCYFNEQCDEVVKLTECRDGRCICRYELEPEVSVDGYVECKAIKEVEVSTRTLDPAMIGVLVGMALMFVIICVVFRLFSQARWRENRTIFNTPNPRLMNVTLLDKKLITGQDRRGSRASIRAPSRQASQQDLHPTSPNQVTAPHLKTHSLHRKKSGFRRHSRAGSFSGSSGERSNRSPTTPTANTSSPILESVTIEVPTLKPLR